jgi:hypothetical protein
MFEDPIYEYPLTESEKAQVRLDMSIQQAFSGLDEIMALAADPLTKHLVIKDRIAMHQLVSRAQLIASFVEAARDQPGKVRMVVNNV